MAKATSARKGQPDPTVTSDAPPQAAAPAPQPSSARSSARKPVHAIRYRGCEAAIWRNETDEGPRYAVTVRKSYRDKNDQWHDAQTFLPSDLPTLAKAINDAHSWIVWQERREQAEKAKGGQP